VSAPPSPPDPDHAEASDEELLGAAGRGDAEAFATLYDRYGPRIMGFCHRLSGERSTAEDLTQETFLRAWRAAPRWRPEGPVPTWLYQIARRAWWKRRDRTRMRRAREARAADLRAGRTEASAGSPEDREFALRLEGALRRLSPRLRLVFVLVRLHGLPYAEAASIAGLRLGTVKSRMAAAEAALRRTLGESP
jgi:RNA polymerase sigma-70 factor (ECF subfamily)